MKELHVHYALQSTDTIGENISIEGMWVVSFCTRQIHTCSIWIKHIINSEIQKLHIFFFFENQSPHKSVTNHLYK